MIYKTRRGKNLTKKLFPGAQGSYQILNHISPECYRIEDIPHSRRGRIHRILNSHVSIIKPYVGRKDIDWEPDTLHETDDEHQEVRRVDAKTGSFEGKIRQEEN